MSVSQFVRDRGTPLPTIFTVVCCLLAIAAASTAGTALAFPLLKEPEFGMCEQVNPILSEYGDSNCLERVEKGTGEYQWSPGHGGGAAFYGGPVTIGPATCTSYYDAPDYGNINGGLPKTTAMLHLSAPTYGLIMEGCVDSKKSGAECHSFSEPPLDLVTEGVIWTDELGGEMNWGTPPEVGFSLEGGWFEQEGVIANIVCTETKVNKKGAPKEKTVAEEQLKGTIVGTVVSPLNKMEPFIAIHYGAENPKGWQGTIRNDNELLTQRLKDGEPVGKPSHSKGKRRDFTFTLYGELIEGVRLEIRTEE